MKIFIGTESEPKGNYWKGKSLTVKTKRETKKKQIKKVISNCEASEDEDAARCQLRDRRQIPITESHYAERRSSRGSGAAASAAAATGFGTLPSPAGSFPDQGCPCHRRRRRRRRRRRCVRRLSNWSRRLSSSRPVDVLWPTLWPFEDRWPPPSPPPPPPPCRRRSRSPPPKLIGSHYVTFQPSILPLQLPSVKSVETWRQFNCSSSALFPPFSQF